MLATDKVMTQGFIKKYTHGSCDDTIFFTDFKICFHLKYKISYGK